METPPLITIGLSALSRRQMINLVPDEHGQLRAFGTEEVQVTTAEPAVKLTDCWRTPPELYASIDAEFGFTVDAAASDDNHLAPSWLTAKDDALQLDWIDYAAVENVPAIFWCNPPYSQSGGPLATWTRKCWEESQEGAVVVMLVPADMSARRMHFAMRHADEVRFYDARVQFIHPATGQRVPGNPWASALIVFRPHVPPEGWPGGARYSIIHLPRRPRTRRSRQNV
jgi:DNA (cytosine-5)-methyltransferase 1